MKESIEEYLELKRLEKDINKKKKEIENKIKKHYGYGDWYEDQYHIIFKETVRKSLNTTLLKKEMPGVYDEFSTEKKVDYFNINV